MILDGNINLEVFREVDVLVIGGGPAGVGATLAAARSGAVTLVVEQFNCLGGVATAGGHGHISKYDESGTGRRIVGGIADEIGERVVNGGFGIRNSHGIWFEVEGLKLLLEQMAEESGAELLYHTFFSDTVVKDGCVVGAVVQNKNGRQIISAKRIVDCTGDGDVAFHAGCPYEVGRSSDGKCQPVTLMFTIGGVDWEKASAWRTDYKMTQIWEEAQRNGDMRPFQKIIMGWWWTPTRPDQVGVNFTHVIYIDSTKAEDLTKATVEARKQAYETIEVYRKYVPGMEQCYMVSTPNTIGIRESRRIMGDYVLTEDDVKAQRKFADNVCYGSFFVDIHCIDGPGMDPTVWNPPNGFKYHIPYRILVPQGIDNLLTAGRCVSCTHVALGSIRVMVPCIGMGEAAGTAAALSLREGITPRQIDVGVLQRQLRKQGAILSEDDIDKVERKNKASNKELKATQ
ncbi:FAD-dependent oxidoreductase [Kistimonas scapharcae]|uniref:FAD-dependent oxidoreductase n=1 Tax=Kistimonas scapharcae TaxID=1036133 RepID=A0ABP8V0Z5_9GAMM